MQSACGSLNFLDFLHRDDVKKAIPQRGTFFHKADCKWVAQADAKNKGLNNDFLPRSLWSLAKWKVYPIGWRDIYENQRAYLRVQFLMA